MPIPHDGGTGGSSRMSYSRCRPTEVMRIGESVARTRYTWNIYSAVRCVFAEWTSEGFAAVPGGGEDCTVPLIRSA